MSVINAVEIDATGLLYREMNQKIRAAVESGERRLSLTNVNGQRYIGTNLFGAASREELPSLEIDIFGTPGNDLGAFLDGPTIKVNGNVMDGSGNTMNRGRIIVNGRAGDITGFSARGGEIFIKGNAGYRVGIHMKEYGEMRPVMVIGGTTQDFLGEYMAGGVVIIMGMTLEDGECHHASHIGTGMHGGAIFVRGHIPAHQLGQGVGEQEKSAEDIELLSKYIEEYGRLFSTDVSNIAVDSFTKLAPLSKRPYKQLYAY